MTRNNTYSRIALVCGFHVAISAVLGQTQLRKVKLGDKMERFALDEIGGKPFAYQPGRGRVSAVLFLAAYQKRSERAIEELKEVVSRMQRDEHPLDLVAIISGGEGVEYFQGLRKRLKLDVPLLLDRDDELWGRLGIIATPTVIVSDKDGMISWIRAGHGYDFVGEARSKLAQALGLRKKKEKDQRKRVKALVNDTAQDRANRHMRMGQLLARKGRLDSAIAELRKAESLTPESVEVQLELGRLLCRAGRVEKALPLVEKIKATQRAEEAQVKMLSGWAHRQLGDGVRAEELLSESVGLNWKSVRALYELGKVYDERGQTERAIEAYRRALAVHFDEVSLFSTRENGRPERDNSGKPGVPARD